MSASSERPRLFDTTLRDGAQTEGISFSVEDKLRIARALDELGVDYIEGGYADSGPKEAEFFERARELALSRAKLVAFGATAKGDPGQDRGLSAVIKAHTPVACIVGKSWDLHVTQALGVSLAENLQMVERSVRFLAAHGREVIFDAEHFFDGYKRNADYAMHVLRAAAEGGAGTVVLCDTNGGTMPFEVAEIVPRVVAALGERVRVGVHFHDDSGCAVANSVTAVKLGARHVQGTINGYGERCGNADLCAVIPNLALKLGLPLLPPERLKRLVEISHRVAEIANRDVPPQRAYVGRSAFAHKAGIHTSAIARGEFLYQHIDPARVGNERRTVMSELGGRSTVLMKAAELGLDLSQKPEVASRVLAQVKEAEAAGAHYDAADGSFELLVRRALGEEIAFFSLESLRVIVDHRPDGTLATEATVKVIAAGRRHIATAEGNGPVHAIDRALRQVLSPIAPQLARVELRDYKVRVLGHGHGTAARIRVLIETTDGERTWGTVGVSENLIEASWRALEDSYLLALAPRKSQAPSEQVA